jgi:hypothetical protein
LRLPLRQLLRDEFCGERSHTFSKVSFNEGELLSSRMQVSATRRDRLLHGGRGVQVRAQGV